MHCLRSSRYDCIQKTTLPFMPYSMQSCDHDLDLPWWPSLHKSLLPPSSSTKMFITAQIFASSILIYQGVHHCCLLCDVGLMAGLLLLALPGELLTCNIKNTKTQIEQVVKIKWLEYPQPRTWQSLLEAMFL